jgi:hypothetical protein
MLVDEMADTNIPIASEHNPSRVLLPIIHICLEV